MRRVAGAFLVVLVAACGARRLSSRSSDLAAADAALLRGCYDCLVEARDAYRRVAGASGGAVAATRELEADLLIALREKELGLPPSSALAEARRVAMELPRELEANRYLEIVDAIPENDLAASPRELQTFAAAARWRALLSSGKLRKPVRDYLRIALDCAYPVDDRSSESAAGTASPGAALLLRYRAAICASDGMAELAAVRAGEPRFVEAWLFMARIEIARLPLDGPRQARAHLEEVLVRFPTSAAVTYLAGCYHQLIGDHAEALRRYDQTLGLRAHHDPALLGRVISLTHLDRAKDAVDAATRFIARAEDRLAEAYYWRARNYHALGQLADARRDVSAGKELIGTEDLLLLAGVIEYEQDDLDVAQADLAIVIAANGRRCEAHWYSGLVDRKRQRWSSARQALEAASACFRKRAQTAANELQSLQARRDIDPAYRARVATSLAAAIASDTRQLHLAALTAASSAAAGGDYAVARSLVDLAAEDPELADRVARLRGWLDRTRPSP